MLVSFERHTLVNRDSKYSNASTKRSLLKLIKQRLLEFFSLHYIQLILGNRPNKQRNKQNKVNYDNRNVI